MAHNVRIDPKALADKSVLILFPPQPSLFLCGLWCFAILVNYYFWDSLNFRLIARGQNKAFLSKGKGRGRIWSSMNEETVGY